MSSTAIGPEDQRRLLELARATLVSHFRGGPLPDLEEADGPLAQVRGAFVTLTTDGRLRGCIGHVVAVEPLWKAVRANVLAAAFNDPRFPPLAADELAGVTIEISALTPLYSGRPEEVEVGRHGLMVERGPARGLLLPQVPVELGWSRERFLEETCRKAGLPAGCWREQEDLVLSLFEAQVFAEGDGV